jgi:phosphate transport system permease protein
VTTTVDLSSRPSASPPPAPTPIRPSPLRPREFGLKNAALLVLSALAALSLVWLVFYQLTLLSGGAGFIICWYATFLILYWVVSALVEGRLIAKERLATVIMWTAALTVLTVLLIVVYFVVSHGWRSLRPHFFVADDKAAGPLSPVGADGGLHAIVGTLEQNGLALLLGGPIAVLTAVFLNEIGGRLARSVRTVVTAMAGIPSIVAGLFIYTIWVVQANQHYSGFAAALALTILLLPTVTRTTEEVLRLVPGGLREASLALGAPEWRTTWSVVLPTARSGVITGVLLGLALTVGETAPLLFTAFGAYRTNVNAFHGPQAALPLVAYTQLQLPSKSQIALGYTTELVLLLLVLVLFVLARIIGRQRTSGSRKRLRGLLTRRKTS